MKVVILAGGLGWRLSDDNELRPKPMTEIGNRPLLWHQMHYFAHFGFNDFIIALGQRGEIIKKYIVDYFTIGGDLVLEGRRRTARQVSAAGAAWRIEMVDTGLKTQTGGRLKRLAPKLGDSTFIVSWGDILHDIDLNAFLARHRRLGGSRPWRPSARRRGSSTWRSITTSWSISASASIPTRRCSARCWPAATSARA